MKRGRDSSLLRFSPLPVDLHLAHIAVLGVQLEAEQLLESDTDTQSRYAANSRVGYRYSAHLSVGVRDGHLDVQPVAAGDALEDVLRRSYRYSGIRSQI